MWGRTPLYFSATGEKLVYAMTMMNVVYTYMAEFNSRVHFKNQQAMREIDQRVSQTLKTLMPPLVVE